MSQLPRRQYDEACAHLKPLLTPRCIEALETLYKPDGTFEGALREAVFTGGDWDQWPRHVSELASMTSDVLSEAYRAHLVACADEFDRVAGLDEKRASRLLLRCANLEYWVGTILHGMAMTAAEAVQGTDVVADERDRHETPVQNAAPCVIKDLQLTGATIKEAWDSNAVLHGLESDAVRPVATNPQWEPQMNADMPVYYSCEAPFQGKSGARQSDADAHYRLQLSNYDALPALVAGQARDSRVVPPNLPVVWTTFSPLRQYLWSLFHSHVIANMALLGGAASHPERAWACLRGPVNDHAHSGTILFQLWPRVKNSRHVFSVAPGQTGTWYRFKQDRKAMLARCILNGESPFRMWLRFSPARRLSECTGSRAPLYDWPLALHVSDEDEGLMGQQTFQTAWHGRGVRRLNAAQKEMMCISLTLTPTEENVGAAREGETADCEMEERIARCTLR